MHLHSISIIFSKHTTFNVFSSLIMLGLRTPFSHVAIRMTDGDTGQVVYYQASGLAVNTMCEAEFLLKETIVYKKDIQASDAVFKAGKTWAICQLGKPYSVPAIFGFALQILLGTVGIKINNPAKADGSQWVCSQLGAGYIEAADKIQLDVTDMTPAALYAVMPTLPDIWE